MHFFCCTQSEKLSYHSEWRSALRNYDKKSVFRSQLETWHTAQNSRIMFSTTVYIMAVSSLSYPVIIDA